MNEVIGKIVHTLRMTKYIIILAIKAKQGNLKILIKDSDER